MPRRVIVTLTEEQRTELLQVRDHHPKPYVREKAAAILKIGEEDLSALEVAQHRLLKRRDDNTVRRWIRRYLAAGIAGLLVGAGRGRKPAFFPCAPKPRRGRPARARAFASQPHALRT